MKSAALWSNSRHFLNVRPVYGLGRFFLDNFPLFVGYGITRGVAEIAYWLSPNVVGNLQGNLRQALHHLQPSRPDGDIARDAERLAYDIIINRGRWFADVTVMSGNRAFADMVHFENRGDWDTLQRRLAGGNGAILASAHVGNWHAGGAVLGRKGLPISAVIYRNHAERFMDEGVAKRGRVGHIFIDGDPFGSMEIVRALRGGRLVAILGDRPWDSQWMEVPYFGRPSRFPIGTVRLARLARVPIFPAFCLCRGRLRYTAVLHEPIEVGTGNPERSERAALEKLATIFEAVVAENLAHWFCFTPAWEGP